MGSASAARRWRLTPAALTLLLVAIVLIATCDDRHVGRAADERQLIWTAVALAETGQMGQAAGHDFTFVSPSGRAVSRFGVGMSLLQVPAAALAPYVEAVLGPGASQPLFLIVPILLVVVAAGSAGGAARLLGAGDAGQCLAVALVGLGSPLGSYAATGFSETLQAAALSLVYTCALGAATTGSLRRASWLARAAGFCASWAILAKSTMTVVAPIALLPLLTRSDARTRRSLLWNAAVASMPGVGFWAWMEWTRFGRLFGSYPGESFSHPWWDGFWRLTIGPNAGIVLFFPATLIAGWVLARESMRSDRARLLRIASGVLPMLILVSITSAWWAWHGVWGWGPRLLVPALPMLAAVASLSIAQWRRPIGVGLVAASMVVNAPGLLQHPVPVAVYVSNLVWPAATEAFTKELPGYAQRRDANGAVLMSPDHVLATVPLASPFIVFPWFWNFDGRHRQRRVRPARSSIRRGPPSGPTLCRRRSR